MAKRKSLDVVDSVATPAPLSRRALQLAQLVQRLRAEYGPLCDQLEKAREGLGTEAVPGDTADGASVEDLHAIGGVIANITTATLAQAERALKRAAEGTYGTCEDCEHNIPLTRLNAVPTATQCVDCANDAERGIPERNRGPRKKRPQGPLDLAVELEEAGKGDE